MEDKHGRKLKTGDLIRFDPELTGVEELCRVYYDRTFRRGWMAERLPPHNPTPQRIAGLGHRFEIVPTTPRRSGEPQRRRA